MTIVIYKSHRFPTKAAYIGKLVSYGIDGHVFEPLVAQQPLHVADSDFQGSGHSVLPRSGMTVVRLRNVEENTREGIISDGRLEQGRER